MNIVFDEQFQFAIRFFKAHEEDIHWLNFECVECVATGQRMDNGEWKLDFHNFDLGRGVEDCTDFNIAYKENPLCNGFIKWDGCMEIHDLSYHFCGYDDVLQRLVKLIYVEASKIIKIDKDLANTHNL